ncbi:MAG: hypothetical protein HY738_09570 [Bacteroidia bacterium]|nr:hypothetical protein [Bacteroidia bacterium]
MTLNVLQNTSPFETGSWSFSIKVEINGFSTLQSGTFPFTCMYSTNPGFLEISDKYYSRYLRYSGSKGTFFAIGENVGTLGWDYTGRSPENSCRFEQYMTELHSYGGNYLRLLLVEFDLQIEWEKLGQYNQHVCCELDRIFDNAKTLHLFIHPTLDWNDRYYDKNNAWNSNPYNGMPGIESALDFMTNSDAKTQYKKYLRYVVSRWGYSTNLAVYELWNEIDGLSDPDPGSQAYYDDDSDRSKVEGWIREMYNYIRNIDQGCHLITLSFSGDPTTHDKRDIWLDGTDIRTAHNYGSARWKNYGTITHLGRYEITQDLHAVTYETTTGYGPVIFGEIGGAQKPCIEKCTDREFHNDLWSTAFMGGYGAGLYWFWQVIHADTAETYWHSGQHYLHHYQKLRNFIANIDFEEREYEPDKWCDGILWIDGKLDSYYLRDENSKEKVFGWIQNRTYHWANLNDNNSCIADILTYDGCYDADGDKDTIEDNDKPQEPISGAYMKITGLKWSWPWPLKKEYYQVTWYNTFTGTFTGSQILHTQVWDNNLWPHIPNTDYNNPDWAYKVEYLPDYEAKNMVDTIQTPEPVIAITQNQSVTKDLEMQQK